MHDHRAESLESLKTSQMSIAEQFLLGTCRCWDAFTAAPDPTLPWRELAPVFAYMNVLGAMCAFECLFAVLAAGGQHRLQFADADDERVRADEARILSALAALQAADTRAAVDVLREVLGDQDVRALVPPLARIASILESQGHRLPRRRLMAEAPQHRIPVRRPQARAWWVETS